MYDEKIEIIYSTILNKNLPDKDIEIFWYSWKNAITNAFQYKHNIIDLFKLDKYSDNLNKLQELNDYVAIQQLIQTYIERHAIISIENYIDSYNCNILNTYLKRWSKLTKKSNKLVNQNIKNSNYNFKLFSLYLTILNDKCIGDLQKNILLDHVIAYRFNIIIDYSVQNNKGNILEKILVLTNVKEYICTTYNITYHNGTKANKILKKINNTKNNTKV